MLCSIRPLYASVFVLLVAAAVLAGCDSDDFRGDPVHDRPPVERPILDRFEVTIDLDSDDTFFDGPFATAEFDAPEITARVAREGLVMAYVRENDTWTALPYTYGIESEELAAVDYTVTLGYAFEAGFVQVFYELSVDDVDVWNDLPARRDVKFVIFGVETVRRNRNFDFKNYEAVQQRFQLNP